MPGEITRRGFMELGAVSLTALSSSGSYDLGPNASVSHAHQSATFLTGPDDALPDTDGDFFAGLDAYAYVYVADNGNQYVTDQSKGGWVQV